MSTHVEIDGQGSTRVDGRPFFLIGARHMPDGGTPEILRDAGFNAYRRQLFGTELGGGDDVPSTDDTGLYFWGYIYDRADLAKNPAYESQLRTMVEQVREHPWFLCYENLNEPTMGYKRTEPSALRAGIEMLRSQDPSHPIWQAHVCHNTVETLRGYNTVTDVVGANPYPVTVPDMRRHVGFREDGRILDCPDPSVHAVGKYTEKMVQVGEGQKPVWMLLQALANENWFNPAHTPELAGQSLDETKVRYPTYEEMRFMTYDAIVHGARGVAFAMWRTPVKHPTWQDIRRVVGELRDLHDDLAMPPIAVALPTTYKDLGFSIWDGVRCRLSERDGITTLIAVNTAFDPAEASIALPSAYAGTYQVVNENRLVTTDNARLNDRFEPYDVHIYQQCSP